MNSWNFVDDVTEWFLDNDILVIFKDLLLFVAIPLLILQTKYLKDFIYLCFHSVKIKHIKSSKIEEEEYKMSKSNRYIKYNDAMVKLQKMKEALSECLRSGKYTYDELTLYETVNNLLTYDIKCDKDKEDVVWLFNNGKFRTQAELLKFKEERDQRRFYEEQKESLEFNVIQDNYINSRINNALIINPIAGFPFITPIGYLLFMIINIVVWFVNLTKGKLAYDDYLYLTIINTNAGYIFAFCICFVISYFIIGGISLKEQYDSEKKLKEIYNKSGLSKPFNKNFAIEAGIYGFNVMQVIGLFKGKKK